MARDFQRRLLRKDCAQAPLFFTIVPHRASFTNWTPVTGHLLRVGQKLTTSNFQKLSMPFICLPQVRNQVKMLLNSWGSSPYSFNYYWPTYTRSAWHGFLTACLTIWITTDNYQFSISNRFLERRFQNVFKLVCSCQLIEKRYKKISSLLTRREKFEGNELASGN